VNAEEAGAKKTATSSCGEQKANMIGCSAMARRPHPLPNDQMSREDLEKLSRSLAMLSPHIVRDRYLQILDRCRFMELATPRMMQELVAHWKLLWKWK
jgi:hypothetical protein